MAWTYPILVSADASVDAPTAAVLSAAASADAPTTAVVTATTWAYPVLVPAPASVTAPTTVAIELTVTGDPASAEAPTSVAIGANASADAPMTAAISAAASVDAPTTLTVESWQVLATGIETTTYEDATAELGVTYQYRVTDALGNVLISNEATMVEAPASVSVPTSVQTAAEAVVEAATLIVIAALGSMTRHRRRFAVLSRNAPTRL